MKKLIAFIFTSLLVPTSVLQAQTENQSLQGQDTSQSWIRQNSTTHNDLKRIYFFGRDSGWVVGDTVLFTTTNGGDRWTEVPMPAGYGVVLFIDYKTGFANNYRKLIKTTNAGLSWGDPVDPIVPAIARAIAIDSDTIFAAGTDEFGTRSTDAGATWKRESGTSGMLGVNGVYALSFVDKQTGYAVGATSTCSSFPVLKPSGVSKTTDGGYTWGALCTGNKIMQDMYGVSAVGSNLVVAVGDVETIAITRDAGNTWDTLIPPGKTTPYSRNYQAVQFLDTSIGYIVGGGGAILKTSNGGRNWQMQNSTIRYTIDTAAYIFLDDVKFVDSSNGWASGDKGWLLHTNNGGTSWVRQYPIRLFQLQSTIAHDESSGGNVLHYQLPEVQHVSIQIFDITGNIIQTVLQNDYEFQGDHSVSVNSAGLAFGSYIYRILTEQYQSIGKFIISN